LGLVLGAENVGLFEASSFGGGPTSGTFVAGEVTFDVTANMRNDGADVFTGIFDPQDAVDNNAYALITPVFFNASVNRDPEYGDGSTTMGTASSETATRFTLAAALRGRPTLGDRTRAD
jgi:hypothetical protein